MGIEEPPGMLDGVVVVDWSQYYAAPGASALLGDMGARIICVEQIDGGDPSRQLKAIGGADFTLPNGQGALFESVGRNKESVAIDVSSAEGQAIVQRLASRADVFHTNFKLPSLEKNRLDQPVLAEINPALIYSRVSAYGPDGPRRDEGGFDFAIQAYCGILDSLRDGGGGVTGPIPLIIDQSAAVIAAQAIVGALYHRLRTGRPQHVHTSLLGTAMTLFYFHGLSTLTTGIIPRPHSNTQPGNPLRNLYECSDGRWIVCAHSPPERYVDRFAAALGIDSSELDPARGEATVVALLVEHFASRPRDEWLRLGQQHGLILAPVNDFREAFAEEQVVLNYVTHLSHPTLGQLPLPGYATHYSETPLRPRRPAPAVGEHTGAILSELCELSSAEIERLRARGVIGGP